MQLLLIQSIINTRTTKNKSHLSIILKNHSMSHPNTHILTKCISKRGKITNLKVTLKEASLRRAVWNTDYRIARSLISNKKKMNRETMVMTYTWTSWRKTRYSPRSILTKMIPHTMSRRDINRINNIQQVAFKPWEERDLIPKKTISHITINSMLIPKSWCPVKFKSISRRQKAKKLRITEVTKNTMYTRAKRE